MSAVYDSQELSDVMEKENCQIRFSGFNTARSFLFVLFCLCGFLKHFFLLFLSSFFFLLFVFVVSCLFVCLFVFVCLDYCGIFPAHG